MKRILALAVVGALAAGVSGCDLSPPAATVNGATISRAQLNDTLSVVSADTVAQCALAVLSQGNGSTLPAVAGSGDATVTTQFAAVELTGLVQQAIEQQGLARRHAAVNAADLAAARQDYETELSDASAQNGSPCNLTGSTLVHSLPAKFLDQQAQALAAEEKLEEVAGHVDVSRRALRAYYDTHQPAVTQLCLNLIVANDQASAQAIHDQIAGGTTFAAAAQGPGANHNGPPGGQEPCVFPSTVLSQLGQSIATAVATLADGQLAPPQSVTVTDPSTGTPSTAWIVVGMRQHHLVAFGDVEGGIRLQLLQQGRSGLSTALTALSARLSVQLDPRYGTWSARRGVSVPTPPPTASLLNPGTGQAQSGSSSLILPPGGRSTG